MSGPNPILTRAIDRLASRADLSADEAAEVLAEVMEGRASEVEAAGFLVALRTKGETVEELTGLARAMRALALRVECARDDLLDTAGTGGGALTFNVSTTAALVAAGAGCAVAKHGNRSATSRSGSADVLEALGARIDLEPAAVAECIDRVGFGFMFAPLHHPAMRHVMPVRRALAVRTTFNFLGPLTNPAGASRQVIGVSDRAYVEAIANALAALGSVRALVVSSDDGLDEMSVSAPTRVVELSDGQTRSYTVSPEQLGLEPAPLASVRAGDPEHNAEVTRAVLAGEPGPERSLVLINAAAAIYAAGRAGSLAEAVPVAAEAIDSGAARAALAGYVETSTELAA
jgi:anthranilate phosphoribosyltransferase